MLITAMLGKSFTAKLLSIALTYALMSGLLPISNHMLSMQTMRMEAAMASQSYMVQGNTGGNSAGSCCDAMGSVSPLCDLMVSQSACVPVYGDSERVLNFAPVIQSIYTEAVIPPPRA